MTSLEAIKEAFESRGVPSQLYEIDSEANEIKLDQSFLIMLRDSTTLWQPLEEALIAEGGQVIAEYNLGV